jgi:serine/threonine protein kinase
MAMPATTNDFLDLARAAQVIDPDRLDQFLDQASDLPSEPHELANFLVEAGLLTGYQSLQLLKGKTDVFRIGPYRILERLGFGAISNVYLCEHQATQERVAVKVLAQSHDKDPTVLKRFYREARAAGKLTHPNIVHAKDVDFDGPTHFLVMEFVDGTSIQDIVQHFGPMDPVRAAHYIRQAASGLQHAHEKGLIHRDIKPGNLLVNRQGNVKILDMGVARFEQDSEQEVLTQGVVLGAPEYLAPEQAEDSHMVDRRADIYALGATFYFMVTGETPYGEEKSLAGKFLSKQTRPPRPIAEIRPDVPADLVAVIDKMMARSRDDRYPTAEAVVVALGPWTKQSIPPPPAEAMPQLSPAARARPASLPPEMVPAEKPTLRGKVRSPFAEGRHEKHGHDHPEPLRKKREHDPDGAEHPPARPRSLRASLADAEEDSTGSSNLRQLLGMLAVLGLTFLIAWFLFMRGR